jgi:lysozyme
MRRTKVGLRMALFLLLSTFTFTQANASGSKLPTITDSTPTTTTTPPATTSDSSSDTTTTTPAPTPTPLPAPAPSPTPSDLTYDWNSPWKKSGTSIVIDAYEGNSIDWAKMATDKKVAAVIHRSSIGTRVDTQYKARKQTALSKGYLWGAYHLGTTGNTIAQADLFLSLVQDDPNTLMILDLENTSSGSLMTIDEAIVFMNHVYEKTGRTLVVYANDSVTKALNAKVASNPRFQQSKLWYARFKSSVTDFPVGIWPGYFLWQFSSELNCTSTGSCLYNVPGTQFDMDVNVFNGTASDLASHWNNI